MGRGSLLDVDINPTGELVAVSGGIGTWIYEIGHSEPLDYFAGGITYGVEWSPDGRYLAVRELQSVLVWDVSAGSVYRRYGLDFGLRDHLTWSNDGQRLAVGTFRNGVRVFDLATGKTLHSWYAARDAAVVKFSADGHYLAAGSQDEDSSLGQIRIWDVVTGKLMMLIETDQVRISSLAWSSDATQLFTADDEQMLTVWDLTGAFDTVVEFDDDGEVIAGVPELNSDSFTIEELDLVLDLEWSSDGTTLRIVDQSGIYRLGSQSRMVQAAMTIPGATALDYRLDLMLFASVHPDGSLQFWDANSDDRTGIIGGHLAEQNDLVWQPGTGFVASGGRDGRVLIWDVKSTFQNRTVNGELFITLKLAGELPVGALAPVISDLAYAPNGQFLAARTDDGSVQIMNTSNWDWEPWIIQGQPEPGAGQVAWSTDSMLLAWDVHHEISPTIEIQGFGFDLHRSLVGHEVSITALAFRPDPFSSGRYQLTSGTADGQVIFWDVNNSRAIRVIQAFSERVNALAWSADGALLAVAGDDGSDFPGRNFIRIYNSAGTRIYEFEMPGPDEARSLAWSSDGRMLASGGSFGQVQIWDFRLRTLVVNLEGHTQAVTGLAWAPEELVLISSARDGTIRIWGLPEENLTEGMD